MSDPVNPSHYTSGSIECIDALEASMSEEAFRGFLKGNIIKYVWRYQSKNGLEDLKKAQWYLEALIDDLQAEESLGLIVEKAYKETMAKQNIITYDPDDYLQSSGCPDGFCPLPNVRQGPPEEMFAPICDC